MRPAIPPLRAALVASLLALLTVTGQQLAGAQSRTPQPPSRQALCEELSASSNPYFGSAATIGNPTDAAPEDLLRGARIDLQQGRFQDAIAKTALLLDPANPQSSAANQVQAAWLAGLANLRLGEIANCLGHTNGELDAGGGANPAPHSPSAAACILPLQNDAIHRDPTATLEAAQHFLAILRRQPRNPTAAWLANLAASLANQPSIVPDQVRLDLTPKARATDPRVWRNIAPALGVDITDLAGGAVVEDLDGDGLLDLVTSTWDPCGGLTAFRNRGSSGFQDVTDQWGLGEIAGGLNLMSADYDNDGRVDLFVTRGAWLLSHGRISNSLLRNTSAPNRESSSAAPPLFLDVTAAVGLATPPQPTQAAVFADFDNDGDLDLYVGNEATAASPHRSQLLRNDAVQGSDLRQFVDVTEDAGVANLRYAKAVAAGDVDNDGDQDLYVSNFGINRLYLNVTATDGKLRFSDQAQALEVTEPTVQSFATWFFDFDNDGDLDLFVADYQQQADRVAASYFPLTSRIGRASTPGGQPLMYLNQLMENGTLSFTEVSSEVGITRPAMPMGANFGDLNGDGLIDLYLGTGEPNLASQFPNQAYLNQGDRFKDITMNSGLAHIQKGHGTAFGDLDNDGDQDLLHQLGGFYPGDPGANALFENLSQQNESKHRWVTLRFRGTSTNRFAVGARVRVIVNQRTLQRTLHRTVGTGGSFGASSLQLEVGLGQATGNLSVEVDWPGGPSQKFTDLELDSIYLLHQGQAQAQRILAAPHVMLRRSPSADAAANHDHDAPGSVP